MVGVCSVALDTVHEKPKLKRLTRAPQGRIRPNFNTITLYYYSQLTYDDFYEAWSVRSLKKIPKVYHSPQLQVHSDSTTGMILRLARTSTSRGAGSRDNCKVHAA